MVRVFVKRLFCSLVTRQSVRMYALIYFGGFGPWGGFGWSMAWCSGDALLLVQKGRRKGMRRGGGIILCASIAFFSFFLVFSCF